jgi:hypothetical protein
LRRRRVHEPRPDRSDSSRALRSVPARALGGWHDRPVSKVTSMRDAVAELVRDGDTVAIEGFTI